MYEKDKVEVEELEYEANGLFELVLPYHSQDYSDIVRCCRIPMNTEHEPTLFRTNAIIVIGSTGRHSEMQFIYD